MKIFIKNLRKKKNLNPADILKLKKPNESDKAEHANEKDFAEYKSGSDIDVPDTELDDEQEAFGSEDEENNYYSLGGENHNDLDKKKE